MQGFNKEYIVDKKDIWKIIRFPEITSEPNRKITTKMLSHHIEVYIGNDTCVEIDEQMWYISHSFGEEDVRVEVSLDSFDGNDVWYMNRPWVTSTAFQLKNGRIYQEIVNYATGDKRVEIETQELTYNQLNELLIELELEILREEFYEIA